MDFTFSLHFHFSLFTHKHGGRRSIAGIKESFKGNAARTRLARGFRNKKISREISCKKFSKISPTSPKFNTHKKIVVHFFIPMLLLPLTPPLIYLKLKRFKGPKMDSLFSLS